MEYRIMYVCTDCADANPEGCGHCDRGDLRVMPDGRWLCDGCFDEEPFNVDDAFDRPLWRDLPPPPEYRSVPALPEVVAVAHVRRRDENKTGAKPTLKCQTLVSTLLKSVAKTTYVAGATGLLWN